MKKPEGVAGVYVKMVRHIRGIESSTLDKFEHYTSIYSM